MGTNFYIKGYEHQGNEAHTDPQWHIGKRSAAGLFCYDCGISLCKGKVHSGDEFHTACPKCGKTPTKETLLESSGGLELGFNSDDTKIKEGVATASSFTFAMSRLKVPIRVLDSFAKYPNDAKVIVDEYGREFNYGEFWRLLKPIPKVLQFTHMVGKEFC